MKHRFTKEQKKQIIEKWHELHVRDSDWKDDQYDLVEFALSLIPEPSVTEAAPQSFWRLLEPGVDVWQEGDDAFDVWSRKWWAVPCDNDRIGESVTSSDLPGRRRVTLPPNPPLEWISLKERMLVLEGARSPQPKSRSRKVCNGFANGSRAACRQSDTPRRDPDSQDYVIFGARCWMFFSALSFFSA